MLQFINKMYYRNDTLFKPKQLFLGTFQDGVVGGP